MEITYNKVNNPELFESFKRNDLMNMEVCQNYIPIYNKFFKLTDNNFNNINLNNKNILQEITNKISENKYKGNILIKNNLKYDMNIFFKFSPLLDPFKYLAGKYDINNPDLFTLPKLNNSKSHNKLLDLNNSAYVDSFFTYLTSQLLNCKDFPHGLDFFGSYLGIKNNYHIDIGDDIDMLSNSEFFFQHKELYEFINSEHEDIFNDQSRSNKKEIILGNEIHNLDILDIENIETIKKIENTNTTVLDLSNINNQSLLYENNNIENLSESSEISSRSSNTNNTNDNNSNISDTDSNESSSSEEQQIIIALKKFPIQIISLEYCENTFDYLLANNELCDDELTCIIIQILMTLITYQKLFDLTHNDLHTNNIMYIKTEKRYLYYKYNDKHYKVPTYGKIFKIIDFGRAIYKYKNNIICSDSFHPDGDAATQYNCEPYYDKYKTLVKPNMSFDLCRLGCSIYDFIIEEYENHNSKMRPIHKIITDWCLDDDGKNMLYKNNNEERYPDFKLYKMIARKVHNHIPSSVINNKLFNKYIVPKRDIKKGSNIVNIDTIDIDEI